MSQYFNKITYQRPQCTYEPNSMYIRRTCKTSYPVGIDMFKHNNRNTRARCEICSKLTTQTRRTSYPVGIYMFKVKDRNTRTRCEICSKLTIQTPERRRRSAISIKFEITLRRRRSGVFIVKFELISHLVLVFLLLNMNI